MYIFFTWQHWKNGKNACLLPSLKFSWGIKVSRDSYFFARECITHINVIHVIHTYIYRMYGHTSNICIFIFFCKIFCFLSLTSVSLLTYVRSQEGKREEFLMMFYSKLEVDWNRQGANHANVWSRPNQQQSSWVEEKVSLLARENSWGESCYQAHFFRNEFSFPSSGMNESRRGKVLETEWRERSKFLKY